MMTWYSVTNCSKHICNGYMIKCDADVHNHIISNSLSCIQNNLKSLVVVTISWAEWILSVFRCNYCEYMQVAFGHEYTYSYTYEWQHSKATIILAQIFEIFKIYRKYKFLKFSKICTSTHNTQNNTFFQIFRKSAQAK